jgi:hypothetical protein
LIGFRICSHQTSGKMTRTAVERVSGTSLCIFQWTVFILQRQNIALDGGRGLSAYLSNTYLKLCISSITRCYYGVPMRGSHWHLSSQARVFASRRGSLTASVAMVDFSHGFPKGKKTPAWRDIMACFTKLLDICLSEFQVYHF